MKNSQLIALVVTVSMLAACTEPDGSPGRGIENGGALSKTDVGTAAGVVAGGVVGGFIGAGVGKAIAVIGGAAIGGVAGNSVGRYLDNQDREAYSRATQRAMNSGANTDWNNPETKHYGTIMPQKDYRDEEGRTCRKYTQKIYIDGKQYIGHGRACREVDGSWKIVK